MKTIKRNTLSSGFTLRLDEINQSENPLDVKWILSLCHGDAPIKSWEYFNLSVANFSFEAFCQGWYNCRVEVVDLLKDKIISILKP